MAKRDMKKALGASLKAEEQAVKSRFEKAKIVPEEKGPVRREQPKPEAAQVITDSFTIPYGEDEMIARIKRRCIKAGISISESEVLTAGLAALEAMKDKELEGLFESLRPVKSGRASRKLRILVVHRAPVAKLPRPLQIKRFRFARRIVANRIVTIRLT